MRKLGITAKLVIITACILTGLGAAVSLYSASQLRGLLYEEMVRRVEAQALNWIGANTTQLILSGDAETLDRLVGDLKKQEGIAYVILSDSVAQRRIALGAPEGLAAVPSARATTTAGRIDWKDMKDAAGLRYFELVTLVSAAGTGMSTDLEAMFGAAAPNANLGELRVGVDRQEFERAVTTVVRKNVALAAGLIVLAILLSFVFASRLSTPVAEMGRASNEIAAGNFAARVQRGVDLQDELGDLVRNFNNMAARLEANREEMNLLYAGLEEKVLERTQELADRTGELEAANARLEQANARLKELDDLKSEFLSVVSHELQNPLTSIRGFAGILAKQSIPDPATLSRFMQIVHTESKRLSRLVDDLLDLTKIESGVAQWNMTGTDLCEIIRERVELLAESLQGDSATKGLRLETVVSEPMMVCADGDRIRQVVNNLLSNAVKFCPDGRIEVRLQHAVSSGPQNDLPGPYVQVAVADTGPGMTKQECSRVFEKFYQGARGRAQRSGSGLGLAISREIVLRHGGEIWVHSVPGAGSTFYFTVPCDAAQIPAGLRVRGAEQQEA